MAAILFGRWGCWGAALALFLLTVIVSLLQPVAGMNTGYDARGTLFKEANRKGSIRAFRIPGNECFNFPPSEDNTLSSIKMTAESCVKLWDGRDCAGKFLRMDNYDNLNYLGAFDDKTSSMSNCEFYKRTKPFKLPEIYMDYDFKVPLLPTYDTDVCVNVPASQDNLISSYDTAGTCVVLWDGWDCTGDSLTINGRANITDAFNDRTSAVSGCPYQWSP